MRTAQFKFCINLPRIICDLYAINFAIRILGTPHDAIWPGVSELPDFKPHFPKWTGKSMAQVVPKLGTDGWDVLEVNFAYVWYNAYTRESKFQAFWASIPMILLPALSENGFDTGPGRKVTSLSFHSSPKGDNFLRTNEPYI